MLSFQAVPLVLMGMLLTAIVLIYRATDRTLTRKPLTKKELRQMTRREIDRYVKKSVDSERTE